MLHEVQPKNADINPNSNNTKQPFVRACYAARWWPKTADPSFLALEPKVAQSVADLLPMLLCGEASAELVFAHATKIFPKDKHPALHRKLQSIEEDEKRHSVALTGLTHLLPSPSSSTVTKQTARFLRRLASWDLVTHLLRISAIDTGVCIILGELCRPHTALAKSNKLIEVLSSIRQDEGRHVRICRECIDALGVEKVAAFNERKEVLEDFAALMSAQAETLITLAVDPMRISKRFAYQARYKK